jgi:hypothetical protein
LTEGLFTNHRSLWSRVTGAAPEVLRSLAPPIEDRLILTLVVGPSQCKIALRPNKEGPVASGIREGLLERMELG